MTTIRTGTSLLGVASLLSISAFLVINDQPAFAEKAAKAEANDFAFAFSYEPAELQTTDGAQALLGRLQDRVEDHCRTPNRETLSERRLNQKCIDATMAKTVREIGSVKVAEVYQDRTDG